MAVMSSLQPFRFLDLPAELRCMVHEAIETTIRKEKLDVSKYSDKPAKLAKKSFIVMLRGALQMSILATCHLVNQEASPIMARKIQTMANEPVRILIDWNATMVTCGLLHICFDTSPKAVSKLAGLRSPVVRFIRSYRSHHVAVAGTRTLGTSVANVEVTITDLVDHINSPDAVDMIQSFRFICFAFDVSFNVFFEKKFSESAHLLKIRKTEDSSSATFRGLTDAEWAENMRELENLRNNAR